MPSPSMSQPESASPSIPLTREELGSALLDAFSRRLSGAILWEGVAGVPKIVFRQGELHLAGPEAPEPAVEPVTPPWDAAPAPAELVALAAALPWTGEASFRWCATVPEGLSHESRGPFPVLELLVQVAAIGAGSDEILRRLGGEAARWESVDHPILRRLPPIDELSRQLLSRFAEPTALGEVLKLQTRSKPLALIRLAQLRALGLVRRFEPLATRVLPSSAARLLDRETLERFLDRIAITLDQKPLALDPEEHRAEIADLLARAGGLSHYELLGLAPEAPVEAAAASFGRMARKVHPRHAEALHLADHAELLRVLFERVTEAYLVLSDPQRRRDYDREIDVKRQPLAASEQEVEAARRDMARRNFERAQGMVRAEEYHYAVELLRDAVRWDPQPRYLSLLGEAEGHNPNWRDDAVANLNRAVQLEPREMAHRLRLGALFEEMGRREPALEQYQAVLVAIPGQPEASAAVARLAAVREEERKGPLAWLERLLRG